MRAKLMNRILSQALAVMACLAVVFAARHEVRLRLRQLAISHSRINSKPNRSNRLVKIHKIKAEGPRSESQWDCPETATLELELPAQAANYQYSFQTCYRLVDVETPPPRRS